MENKREATPNKSIHFLFALYRSMLIPVALAPAPIRATGMAAQTPQNSSRIMIFNYTEKVSNFATDISCTGELRTCIQGNKGISWLEKSESNVEDKDKRVLLKVLVFVPILGSIRLCDRERWERRTSNLLSRIWNKEKRLLLDPTKRSF